MLILCLAVMVKGSDEELHGRMADVSTYSDMDDDFQSGVMPSPCNIPRHIFWIMKNRRARF